MPSPKRKILAGPVGIHQAPTRHPQIQGTDRGSVAPRNQVRRLPDPDPPEQRQAQGLHSQRPGLDRAVLRDRRRLDIPGQAILDGEVVVIKDGRANFSELQVKLAAGTRTG